MTARTTRILRWSVVVYGLFLILIIFTANTGIEHPGSVLVRNLPWGDKLGHIVLFGVLTFVVNLALRCRTIGVGRLAVPLGSLLVAIVVVIEELSQGLLDRRTLDVGDLAADAIGIIIATILAFGLWRFLARRRSATGEAASTTVGDVATSEPVDAEPVVMESPSVELSAEFSAVESDLEPSAEMTANEEPETTVELDSEVDADSDADADAEVDAEIDVNQWLAIVTDEIGVATDDEIVEDPEVVEESEILEEAVGHEELLVEEIAADDITIDEAPDEDVAHEEVFEVFEVFETAEVVEPLDVLEDEISEADEVVEVGVGEPEQIEEVEEPEVVADADEIESPVDPHTPVEELTDEVVIDVEADEVVVEPELDAEEPVIELNRGAEEYGAEEAQAEEHAEAQVADEVFAVFRASAHAAYEPTATLVIADDPDPVDGANGGPDAHISEYEHEDEDEAPDEQDSGDPASTTTDVVATDVMEIEAGDEVVLPTMADLDEVSADLDRIDAALVALDRQR